MTTLRDLITTTRDNPDLLRTVLKSVGVDVDAAPAWDDDSAYSAFQGIGIALATWLNQRTPTPPPLAVAFLADPDGLIGAVTVAALNTPGDVWTQKVIAPDRITTDRAATGAAAATGYATVILDAYLAVADPTALDRSTQ